MVRLSLAALTVLSLNSFGQIYPTSFAQQTVSDDFSWGPIVMAFAPDNRIFVGQQSGAIRVVKDGALLPVPFTTLHVDYTGERGLLGIAVDPDFAINGYVYAYYTVPATGDTPAHNRLSRFTANGDVALPDSEVLILDFGPLTASLIHNGGAIRFAPDGKLFVAVGDNKVSANVQNLDSYHGKLLRINPDGSVPEGNPYTTGSEQRRRVWAYGLRNPFTLAINDRTGQVFVNDVGSNAWEEINDATLPGRNFGWPFVEGKKNNPNYTDPLYTYPHTGEGSGCAITGGTFFNPTSTSYPGQYYSKYFFIDFCGKWIKELDYSGPTPVVKNFAVEMPIDVLGIDTGPDGNLYYLDRHSWSMHKVIFNANSSPFIVDQPKPARKAEGDNVTLKVTSIGSEPLVYQWQKDNVNIPGATSANYQILNAQADHSGNYRVIVSNVEGSDTSNIAAVQVSSSVPIAVIRTPSENSKYSGGTTIDFSGFGYDFTDGVLPESAFSWTVDFHHNTHHHDHAPINGVSTGSFHVSEFGETSSNVFYRITLTVTNSVGISSKDSVDVLPRKSLIHLHSVPEGLPLTVDGEPFITPATIESVQGMVRSVGILPEALPPFEFDSWENCSGMEHTFAMPDTDTTFTAKFTTVTPYISKEPDDVRVNEGERLELAVSAFSSAPFTYQWQKFQQNIENATTESIVVDSATLSHSGVYRVILQSEHGSDTSKAVGVTVLSNHPVVQILSPTPGDLYTAGSTISLTGVATDLQEGLLPDSAFEWTINFFRDGELIPFDSKSGSRTSQFMIPNEGELSANVWFSVLLRATDSNGYSDVDSVTFYPRTSTISLNTIPEGLKLVLDGQEVATPVSVISVEGMKRTIGVAAQPPTYFASFDFEAWAHGGDAVQTVVTPTSDTTFIARFQVILAPESGAGSLRASVFPNPAHRNAMLAIHSDEGRAAAIRVVNSMAAEAATFDPILHAGENHIPLDLSRLANGLYTVEIKTGVETRYLKLIVARQ